MIEWDCGGVEVGIDGEGRLKKWKDKEKEWSVEMGIGDKGLRVNLWNGGEGGKWWGMKL